MPNPKLKTVKSVKSRFRVTGTGKLISHKAGRRHLLHGKRSKLKRQMRRPTIAVAGDERQLKALIPYHV